MHERFMTIQLCAKEKRSVSLCHFKGMFVKAGIDNDLDPSSTTAWNDDLFSSKCRSIVSKKGHTCTPFEAGNSFPTASLKAVEKRERLDSIQSNQSSVQNKMIYCGVYKLMDKVEKVSGNFKHSAITLRTLLLSK
jgi:hypothetical protein